MSRDIVTPQSNKLPRLVLRGVPGQLLALVFIVGASALARWTKHYVTTQGFPWWKQSLICVGVAVSVTFLYLLLANIQDGIKQERNLKVFLAQVLFAAVALGIPTGIILSLPPLGFLFFLLASIVYVCYSKLKRRVPVA